VHPRDAVKRILRVNKRNVKPEVAGEIIYCANEGNDVN
jgi:hypothetical protein